MSSSQISYTLESQKFSKDHEVPLRGEVIKLRLPNRLQGPGSIIGSSAVTGATPNNYHSAVVISAMPDYANGAIHMVVYPIPAYSRALLDGLQSSTAWLHSQPVNFVRLHIPMPSEDQDEPPDGFGEALWVGGYKDRRQSWILLQSQAVVLTSTWKRFRPKVILSGNELHRLATYSNHIAALSNVTQPSSNASLASQSAPSGTSNQSVFVYRQPEDSPEISCLFNKMFNEANKSNVLYLTDDSESSIDRNETNTDSVGVADDEPWDPIHYLSLWSGEDGCITDLVRALQLEKGKQKEADILEWLNS